MLNWVLSWFGRVWCDRCHSAVEGFMPDAMGMSGGVYVGWTHTWIQASASSAITACGQTSDFSLFIHT